MRIVFKTRKHLMQNLESFKAELQQPKKIVITTHQNPDADALGSSLGLYNYLIQYNHDVKVISPTDYPEFLHWMKGNEEVWIYDENDHTAIDKFIKESDFVFCLDFSSLNRINELGEIVRNSSAKKVLIDHHLNPEDFAAYTLWSTDAAATAELVFDLIDMLGDQDKIDSDIAECLYAGIMTDTGSFKHPSTSAKVHEIVAQLIKHGAEVSKVNKLIYDNNSVNRLKFIGFALSERLFVLEKLHVAYILLSQNDMNKFNLKSGDTEGLVNYALSIKGIKMAAIIMDKGDLIKMSFRSVGDFSVNEFAKQNFDGGGHKNAAGGASSMTLKETEEKFLTEINKHREQLVLEN